MADAAVSKTVGVHPPCGFDSRPRHQFSSRAIPCVSAGLEATGKVVARPFTDSPPVCTLAAARVSVSTANLGLGVRSMSQFSLAHARDALRVAPRRVLCSPQIGEGSISEHLWRIPHLILTAAEWRWR